MRDDILQVRAPALNFYVLKDASGLYLLDGGFVGALWFLERALRRRGWLGEPIRGIIITHGHLDHILNVGRLARAHGAWIAAPRLDADHYAGRPAYNGWALVTQWLEWAGRPLFGFDPFVPDRWIDDGDVIDVWHGLRAVHLPGHTRGHTGYYCQQLKLLFAADLFSSHHGGAHLPPAIFNSAPRDIAASMTKALALDLVGMLPNHCDQAEPEEHLARLRQLDRTGGPRRR